MIHLMKAGRAACGAAVTSGASARNPGRVTCVDCRPPQPEPVKFDSRTCFGLAWYTTEADAARAGQAERDAGHTVNGGFLHGMPCGRAPEHDHVDPALGQLYAVRTA